MDNLSSKECIQKLYSIVPSDYVNAIELVDRVKNGSASLEERQELIDLVNDEFINKGLNSDDEPNQYGIELERILDVLNEIPIK